MHTDSDACASNVHSVQEGMSTGCLSIPTFLMACRPTHKPTTAKPKIVSAYCAAVQFNSTMCMDRHNRSMYYSICMYVQAAIGPQCHSEDLITILIYTNALMCKNIAGSIMHPIICAYVLCRCGSCPQIWLWRLSLHWATQPAQADMAFMSSHTTVTPMRTKYKQSSKKKKDYHKQVKKRMQIGNIPCWLDVPQH